MIVSQQNINVTSINVKNHRARTRGAFSVYLRETLKVMGTATRKKEIRESEFQEISRKMSSLKMVLRWHVRAVHRRLELQIIYLEIRLGSDDTGTASSSLSSEHRPSRPLLKRHSRGTSSGTGAG